MHSEVLEAAPGECPVCGMALVAAATGKGESPDDPSGTVTLTPQAVRLAGIRLEQAVEGGVVRKLRVQGFVVPDPERERHVVSRLGGWLETLHVNASGVRVERGDPLYTIHAPDLVPLQEQYLFLLRSNGATDARLEIVRQRMSLYDLPETLPAALEGGAGPSSSITFPARSAGYVRIDGVFEGMQIEPNTDMMTITDLSSVWIEADLFEADVAGVAAGRDVSVAAPSVGGWSASCRIAAVAPSLDPVKGTLRVWAACPNDGMALKPGMTVLLESPMRSMRGVLVPSPAVFSDGAVNVVYVESGPGRFARREVSTGLRDGTVTQILDGIAAGETVVTRGAFLIDAERRLRERSRGVPGAAGAGSGESAAAPAVVAVSRGVLEVPLRASGRVAEIPDRVHHVVMRTMGWVRDLEVKATGTKVRAGDTLFTLDAPDLVPIQEEYLLSLTGVSQPTGSGQGTGVEGALGRLKRHGVQDQFIRELGRTGRTRQVIPFVSPIAGYVTLGMVYEGQRVDPGMELMVVSDLSKVWVEAELFPAGAAAAVDRRTAQVSLLHDPAATREGSVIGVDPFLDPASRAMTLRVLCANDDLAMRPGMSALVDLGVEPVEGLIVPDAAVVDTGMRQVAFVQEEHGGFAPREVMVGARAEGRAQILSGLAPGERVAASGSFLLDPDAAMPRGTGGGSGEAREDAP